MLKGDISALEKDISALQDVIGKDEKWRKIDNCDGADRVSFIFTSSFNSVRKTLDNNYFLPLETLLLSPSCAPKDFKEISDYLVSIENDPNSVKTRYEAKETINEKAYIKNFLLRNERYQLDLCPERLKNKILSSRADKDKLLMVKEELSKRSAENCHQRLARDLESFKRARMPYPDEDQQAYLKKCIVTVDKVSKQFAIDIVKKMELNEFKSKSNELCIDDYLDTMRTMSKNLVVIDSAMRDSFYKNAITDIGELQKKLIAKKNDFQKYEQENTTQLIENKSKEYAEPKRRRFNTSNIRLRTEQITWVYNEELKTFHLKDARMLSTDGNNETHHKSLDFTAIVYASTHDSINTLDSYMELKKKLAPQKSFY